MCVLCVAVDIELLGALTDTLTLDQLKTAQRINNSMAEEELVPQSQIAFAQAVITAMLKYKEALELDIRNN